MDAFYAWLGPKKSKRIRLAVMDMWKPFRNSTLKPEHAPQAAILFDKFHILRHLGEALDKDLCPIHSHIPGIFSPSGATPFFRLFLTTK